MVPENGNQKKRLRPSSSAVTRNRSETIVAIATPSGRGGVGVVRLSGSEAGKIGGRLFSPRKKTESPWPSHQMIFGTLRKVSDDLEIDEGYAVRFEAPHSYTGEEVVEFQIHGSPAVLQEVVAQCINLGADLALPGEFTRRAFIAGKLDLVQAEAVAELVNAQSEAEVQAAQLRRAGKLSHALNELRKKTVSLLAECEADIDFPEENLSLPERNEIRKNFEYLDETGRKLRKTYETNQRLSQGFLVTLTGRPNVGKSSLYNALLGVDRAIVTPQPGTTRDVLRDELIVSGRRVRIVDTAGLRSQSENIVEEIGMERAVQELRTSDLILLVKEAPKGSQPEEEFLVEGVDSRKIWVIWNKSDVIGRQEAEKLQGNKNWVLSAKTGAGVGDLLRALEDHVQERVSVGGEGGISNDRQRDLLDKYLHALNRAKKEWEKEASPEFVAFELRQAHEALSRLVGKGEGIEDILNEVFSRFCIGK